jgi:hypothetical protein
MRYVRRPDGRLERVEHQSALAVRNPEPVAPEILAACEALRVAQEKIESVAALLIRRGECGAADNITEQLQDTFSVCGLWGSINDLR